MGYRDEIKRLAEARGIALLLHFTKFPNLKGIVDRGLLSRAEVDERGLDAQRSDQWRLDGDDHATSLSISDINREMFSAKRKKDPSAVWAVLVLQPSILWTHECRFCYRNAAHKDLIECRKFRGGPWGFASMFENQPPASSSHLPTRYDAEVQVRERIAPELIMGVHINRCDLAETARALLKQLPGDDRSVIVQDF